MVNLPAEDSQAVLSSSIDEKDISEIKEQLTKFADKLPLSQISEEEEWKVYSAASELGVDVDLFSDLTSETLNDDEKFKEFLKPHLYRKRIQDKQNELKDRLMADAIIPQNIRRIMSEVFPPEDIIIEKNLTYPQPHKKENEKAYAIRAIKK